jgi:sugar phosphate permease
MHDDSSPEGNGPNKQGDRPKTKRPRRFYGWTIIGVVSLVSFAGGVETNPILGVFQKPITAEFGWSRAMFTLPMAIGTFAGGLTAVFMGPIMDRYGGRWVMTAAVILMGALFVAMGMMHSLWQYFILQFLGRTLVASTFFLIVGVIVPKWFIAKRGRAIGVASLGQRLGHAAYPAMIGWVMAISGWRAASISLGISVWIIALLPSALFLRREPQDVGQHPDGRIPDLRSAQTHGSAPRPVEEVSFSRKQALRTPAFYFLLGALATQSFVATGINFHWYSYLTGNGVSTSATVTSLAIAPLVGMPAMILTGFVVEKVAPQLVLAAAYLLTATSIIVLLVADSAPIAILFGVIYGTAAGIQITNNQIIWADYFGRDSIGAIRGLISPILMSTNAMGPFAAALWFDFTGGYSGIFMLGIGLLVGAAGLAVSARKPVLRATPAPAAPG